ncbi:hypothetical protein [Bacillus sp. N6]|uniref:hypothetical protein n=1 Tax=Bacillus sp. N6 TaxID=127893 RepID=UPI004056AA07
MNLTLELLKQLDYPKELLIVYNRNKIQEYKNAGMKPKQATDKLNDTLSEHDLPLTKLTTTRNYYYM